MDFILIRHTKIAYPEGFCYGQTDVDVANSFEDEALQIVNKIENYTIKEVYSSPLKRCAILAERITQRKNEVIFDNRLKELNFGNWEGKSWDEVKNESLPFFSNFNIENRCPGGESYLDLLNRVSSFIKDLQTGNEGIICIVTHGGPIRAFFSLLNNYSYIEAFNIKIDFGEVIQFFK